MPFSRWTNAIAEQTVAGIASPTSIGLACLLLTACSSAPPSSNEENQDRLQVVTTFLPITQFTKAVAGSCAEVTQLLPSNVGPHDYQAKPTDAQLLAQADVLVQNGLELEQFLEPMVQSAGNGALAIIDSSARLELLSRLDADGDEHGEEHGDEHGEEHGDEHGEEHGDEHGKEHGDEHGEEHHHSGEYDPHIWLDPIQAVGQVNNIRDGLIAAAPDCEAEFTANAAAYGAQLKAFDQETQAALAPFAGKTFVTYHDFAGYFGDRYNLKIEYLVSVPEQNPSPSDVRRVMAAAQASELKTLLVESATNSRPFEAIAQDLNVQISTFSPNAVGDSSEPEAYFTVMRENVANLQVALAGE